MYHGKTEFLTELSSAVYKYIDIPLEKVYLGDMLLKIL